MNIVIDIEDDFLSINDVKILAYNGLIVIECVKNNFKAKIKKYGNKLERR